MKPEIDTSTNAPVPAAEVRRNRRLLLLIIGIFALPVILAYAGFFGGWFTHFARANKGELQLPTQSLTEYALTVQGKPFQAEVMEHRWWLLLVQDRSTCDEICDLQLLTLNQTWIGMGKEQERVTPVLLTPEPQGMPAQWRSLQGTFHEHAISDLQAARHLQSGSIYIVDPMGNIVLRYDAPQNKSDALIRSKDIKADFVKLLKFSHIG